MKKLAIGLCLFLGGCNTTGVTAAWSALTGATISPQAIYVAANSFDALEVTATNYLRLPKCPQVALCRDQDATKQIVPAIRSGRVARNNAKQFLRDHPGELGTQGLYDALMASVNTLQAVYAQYHIGGSK